MLLIVCVVLATVAGVTSCSRQNASTEPSVEPLTHAQTAGPPALKTTADKLKATILTPHLEQKIVPGKNVLWCSTFQLAWNELCDLAGGPVKLKPPSPMADILNKRQASKADLDDASYVARAGLIGDGIEQKIKAELKQKFAGRATPELLDLREAVGWATYSYLFKSLPFDVAFERLHGNLEFGGRRVDSFGIPFWDDHDQQMGKRASQVVILDYRPSGDQSSPGEFIVELKTLAQDDRLILARVTPKQDLAETIRDVWGRIGAGQPAELQHREAIMVPVLNFDVTRDYGELLGHVVKNEPVKTGLPIAVARQLVRFKLDETGAVLKSEAMFAPMGGSPRSFIFDKPFLILLQRKDAKNPYFALWVDNSELLVSSGGRL